MGEEQRVYGGDSVGKKIARFDFWTRARLWHGGDFASLRHLVLSSRDGGDVRVLRALRVPAGNILAVDIDQEALDECREKFPGVVALHGDVKEVLAAQSCLGTCFLDFCGWATDDQVEAVAMACRAVRQFGIVGHGFMRAREQPKWNTERERERFASLRRNKEYVEALYDDSKCAKRVLFDQADGRHGWLLGRLLEKTKPDRIAPFLLWMTRYHSTCSWRKGVPMMIFARAVNKFSACLDENRFIKARNEFGSSWCQGLEWCEAKAWALAEEAGVDPRQPNGHSTCFEITEPDDPFGPRQVYCPLGKIYENRTRTSVEMLVEAAGVADELVPGFAHELLNVRKGRLAAFRAHVTRGTYSKTA